MKAVGFARVLHPMGFFERWAVGRVINTWFVTSAIYHNTFPALSIPMGYIFIFYLCPLNFHLNFSLSLSLRFGLTLFILLDGIDI